MQPLRDYPEPSDHPDDVDVDEDAHADISIADVDDEDLRRICTGIAPLDLVLGGGLVLGGVVLLGGAPGAGKSTLTMQAAHGLAASDDACSVLYATAEESIAQVAMRGRRLEAAHERIRIMACHDVDTILARARQRNPTVLIVDSISKMETADVTGIAGSVSQVKECTGRIADFARATGCTVFLIGHVTRDGTIAGPRTLDHLVDAVLFFDKGHDGDGNETTLRFLRSHKNRFADATAVGAFEMTATGLVPSFHDPDDQSESLVPVMQEILDRYRALGGVVDEGLRDRIAGRLD